MGIGCLLTRRSTSKKAGYSGRRSRRRGTLLRECPPAFGLLLDFAAQGTPSACSFPEHLLIGRTPATCPCAQGVGCSPQRNQGGGEAGGHSRRGVPGGLRTRPEQRPQPMVIKLALPPAAAVFTLSARSTTRLSSGMPVSPGTNARTPTIGPDRDATRCTTSVRPVASP